MACWTQPLRSGGGEWHGASLARTGPTAQLDAFPLTWVRIWMGASVWAGYREEGYYLYPSHRSSTGVGVDAQLGFDLVTTNLGFGAFVFEGTYKTASFIGLALGPTFRF